MSAEAPSTSSSASSFTPTVFPGRSNDGVIGGGDDQYLPGAASLIEQLDKRIMIILRDGKHLCGKLRSFDQFLNLVLEDSVERVLLPSEYCDIDLGLYIVRGDQIVLLGEIDDDMEQNKMKLKKITPEEFANLDSQGATLGQGTLWDFVE